MNIYSYYFAWGYGLGLLNGSILFFFLGRAYDRWVWHRSEYKKMRDDFNKQFEKVSKAIDERTKESL